MTPAANHQQPTDEPGRPARDVPWTFEAAVKDPVVEEPVDWYFNRRIAIQVIQPLRWMGRGITPAKITLVAALFGVASGVSLCLVPTRGSVWYVAGGLLLFASVILDCADGMVARLRGGGTPLGMLLDGAMDLVVGVSVWFGVSYAYLAGRTEWWGWPVAFFALVSIVLHCALYDNLKNFFVRHSLPRADRPPIVAAAPKSAAWRMVNSVYLTAYGSVAKVFGTGEDAALEASEPAEFRQEFSPTMRMACWLGLGSHLTFVYVCIFFGLIDRAIPFYGVLAFVGLVQNVLVVFVVASRKRAVKRLRERLAS
ncbi:MAG: CDP-alcohol phosphatidyltransferase family protein [Deltaproteobacteria bacterium]|nr:CDP-alcohol phosphatidyltransferase family protein [Deltaproteobacteria bacterium]